MQYEIICMYVNYSMDIPGDMLFLHLLTLSLSLSGSEISRPTKIL